MALIDSHRLAGKEVNGNSISGKSIDGQNVVLLRLLRRHRQPGIAGDNFNRGRGLASIGEKIARDGLDQRVDVIKTEDVALASVCRKRTGAQPDHGYAPRLVAAAEIQGQYQDGIGSIVSGRRLAQFGSVVVW